MTVQAPPEPVKHGDLQALIEEARRRARRRRRRNATVTLVVVLMLAGGYVLATRAGGDRTASRSVIARSSAAPLAVGVGPSGTRARSGRCARRAASSSCPGIMHRCGSSVWFDVLMSLETWIGTDGTMRERSVEVSQRFASPADRRRWQASGKPVPVPISVAQGDALDVGSGHFPSTVFGQIAPDAPPTEGPPPGAGPVDVGDGLFSYRQLLALPAGGTAALVRIDRAWTGLRRRYGVMLQRWHSPGAKVVARADLTPIANADRADPGAAGDRTPGGGAGPNTRAAGAVSCRSRAARRDDHSRARARNDRPRRHPRNSP